MQQVRSPHRPCRSGIRPRAPVPTRADGLDMWQALGRRTRRLRLLQPISGHGNARTLPLKNSFCVHGSKARQRGYDQRGQYTHEALVAALDFDGRGARGECRSTGRTTRAACGGRNWLALRNLSESDAAEKEEQGYDLRVGSQGVVLGGCDDAVRQAWEGCGCSALIEIAVLGECAMQPMHRSWVATGGG